MRTEIPIGEYDDAASHAAKAAFAESTYRIGPVTDFGRAAQLTQLAFDLVDRLMIELQRLPTFIEIEAAVADHFEILPTIEGGTPS